MCRTRRTAARPRGRASRARRSCGQRTASCATARTPAAVPCGGAEPVAAGEGPGGGGRGRRRAGTEEGAVCRAGRVRRGLGGAAGADALRTGMGGRKVLRPGPPPRSPHSSRWARAHRRLGHPRASCVCSEVSAFLNCPLLIFSVGRNGVLLSLKKCCGV